MALVDAQFQSAVKIASVDFFWPAEKKAARSSKSLARLWTGLRPNKKIEVSHSKKTI